MPKPNSATGLPSQPKGRLFPTAASRKPLHSCQSVLSRAVPCTLSDYHSGKHEGRIEVCGVMGPIKWERAPEPGPNPEFSEAGAVQSAQKEADYA